MSSAASIGLSLMLVLAGATAAISADDDAEQVAIQLRAGSIEDFIKANPDCLEFNDQCSFCSVVDGVAECGTPQIACVKRKSSCTKQLIE